MYPQRGMVEWNFPESTSVTHISPVADSLTSMEYAPLGFGSIAFTAAWATLFRPSSWTILATDGVPVIPEGEMCLKGYSSLSRA